MKDRWHHTHREFNRNSDEKKIAMAAKADQNIKKKPRFPHLSLKTAVTMVVMNART